MHFQGLKINHEHALGGVGSRASWTEQSGTGVGSSRSDEIEPAERTKGPGLGLLAAQDRIRSRRFNRCWIGKKAVFKSH
jgi:hypothetical protein